MEQSQKNDKTSNNVIDKAAKTAYNRTEYAAPPVDNCILIV
jgi:hypothetical protein